MVETGLTDQILEDPQAVYTQQLVYAKLYGKQMPILEVTGYTKSFHIHHLNCEIPVFDGLDFRLFVTQFLRPRPRVSALKLVEETVYDTGGESAMAQAEAMLTEFGLKRELWQAYLATFSGGEQQKVNLARALIRPRRLLLLDEPTASLDAVTRESLERRMAELKAEGVAMIGVFHHPEDVAHLIDDEIRLSVSQLSVNGDYSHVAE